MVLLIHAFDILLTLASISLLLRNPKDTSTEPLNGSCTVTYPGITYPATTYKLPEIS